MPRRSPTRGLIARAVLLALTVALLIFGLGWIAVALVR